MNKLESFDIEMSLDILVILSSLIRATFHNKQTLYLTEKSH